MGGDALILSFSTYVQYYEHCFWTDYLRNRVLHSLRDVERSK